MSKCTASDFFTDDELARAETPELRKKLEAERELDAYMLAHPMDPRPMHEADARAKEGLPEPKQLQVGVAVEEALKYGLEIGWRAGIFGVDASRGRKYTEQQNRAGRSAAASRKEETEVRHREWRADMDELHRKHKHWSKRRLAMR